KVQTIGLREAAPFVVQGKGVLNCHAGICLGRSDNAIDFVHRLSNKVPTALYFFQTKFSWESIGAPPPLRRHFIRILPIAHPAHEDLSVTRVVKSYACIIVPAIIYPTNG